METWDKDVEELRAENSRQSDRYDELWKAYDALFSKTQKMRSRIIFLSPGSPAEGYEGWLGSTNCDPESPGSRLRGSGNQLGRQTNQAGSSDNCTGYLVDDQRATAVVPGRAR